jgi:hypothetical protein
MKKEDLNIDKLLEDISRSVDYVFDKGIEFGKQQTLKDVFKILNDTGVLCYGDNCDVCENVRNKLEELGEIEK